MSEQASSATPTPTGVTSVDAAVAAVSMLEDRPLDEHVAAYEAAHDELRRALDAAPESA